MNDDMNSIIDKAIEELSDRQGRYVTEEEETRIITAMGMLEQFGKDWDARALAMKQAQQLNFDRAWDEAHMVNHLYEIGRAKGYLNGYEVGYKDGCDDTIIKL